MKAKFKLTREQSIFIVRRNIIDYIWKSAKLEGLQVTYPDTDAIYNGISVPGVKVSEMIAINNLKHAWQFVLEHLGDTMDYALIRRINKEVVGENEAVKESAL